ncbi:hypothetical protein OUZ56_023593 [Daphnia magna]|uniref:Uncharacterized protein n=1 Tax=Daphnia magna TaxID=35525 RepID=A0ABR0AZA0_9CRUS|nr:hypothetical protein OUZ56_023593 [Daphnia magna]
MDGIDGTPGAIVSGGTSSPPVKVGKELVSTPGIETETSRVGDPSSTKRATSDSISSASSTGEWEEARQNRCQKETQLHRVSKLDPPELYQKRQQATSLTSLEDSGLTREMNQRQQLEQLAFSRHQSALSPGAS